MKEKLNLNNPYRVLLTEVLPYELPLMLDNEGFYKNMQKDELKNIFESVLQDYLETEKKKEGKKNEKKKLWTIPFDYCVRKSGSDNGRKLSLMHPAKQLACVDFYKKHDAYMLSLCCISPFSIRYIAKRAQCIFHSKDEELTNEKSSIGKHVELLDDEIEKYYRSYFSYKKYDMMYKFFYSDDYLRLEQKYPYCLKMDIEKCFYHIYTHSIAWAIKGKEIAKQDVSKGSFENDFDKLMQQMNYKETNGIIVGPEISRIFAEIILQRIDVNVQSKVDLRLGRDYEIRRYVDDHYIYAYNQDNLQKILNVYRQELEFYKLFINESKNEIQ